MSGQRLRRSWHTLYGYRQKVVRLHRTCLTLPLDSPLPQV